MIDPELQRLLTAYQGGGANPSGGIPNELYQYAQQNPSAGIDRSGQNLQSNDPMFNFYNPLSGQTPGQDWFNYDPRNMPAADPLQRDTQSLGDGDYMQDPQIPGLQQGPQMNFGGPLVQEGPMTGGIPQPPAAAPATAPGPLPVVGGQPANYTPQANAGGGVIDNGLYGAPTLTPELTPAPQQIPNQFSGQFMGDYNNYMNNIASQMQGIYNYQTPQAAAAQTQLGMVPQPHVTQMGTSSELQQLLSGAGLDPATLAKMHATVGDRYASTGAQLQSQSKRQLAQAGLQGSPAGAAISGDIARNNMGEANTAQNNVDIQNALLGNSNKMAGVGFQTNIGLSNMGQANQMAMENANRLFAAMQQNTANTQQTSLSNAGAQQNQALAGANQTTGFLGNQANAFGNASLNRNINADFGNAQNMQNWNSGNADRTNRANEFNVQNNQRRWETAAGGNSLGNYTA